MKSLLRNTIVNSFSLFIASQILSGVKITGGLQTYIFSGIILTIMTLILRPILQLITLPLNLITFGTFSFLINVIILYLLTVVVPQISIKAFTFPGLNLYGFIFPKIELNTFFAFIVVSIVISAIMSFVFWLIK